MWPIQFGANFEERDIVNLGTVEENQRRAEMQKHSYT